MILKFEDIEDYSKVGNKAKFLSIMKKNGFNVPSGFVIDSDSYVEIINDNEIVDSINQQLEQLNSNNVKEISKNITLLFNNVEFNEQIWK